MPIIDLPLEQLKVYKLPLTRRSDFQSFWNENRRLSEEQPLNPVLKKLEYPVKRLEAYLLSFDGFMDKTPVKSWFIKPVGKGPFPALLFPHGYGWHRGTVSDYLGQILQGVAVMAIDVRGQFGDTPDFAKYPSGSVTGYMTKGILDKNTYYYRYVYMDCARALKILYELLVTFCFLYGSRSSVNPFLHSISGFLAMLTGILSEAVSLCCHPLDVTCFASKPFS
jgi:cephalosporin-C deacetylase